MPHDAPREGLDDEGRALDGVSALLSNALGRILLAYPADVARLIDELHRRVHDADSLLDLMARASREATRLLVDADWAGVTARFADEPFTAAATDDLVLIVDESQYSEGDGPCLTAARLDQQVAVGLPEVRERWPMVAGVAEHVGVRSFLAEPLHYHSVPVGSLNLYSARDEGLRVPDPDILIVLLEYLERGLRDYSATQPGEGQAWRLQQALSRQQMIHQAVGVLMAKHDLDAEHAIEILNDEAERRSGSVDIVAAEVIAQQRRRAGDS